MAPDLEAVGKVVLAHGVAVSWVFGSTARDDRRSDSDTDVAVLVPADRRPLDLLEQSNLAADLEAALGGPVDIVAFERAPPALRARIVIEGELVASTDETLRVRTVVETLSRWEDLRPALAEMDAAYLTSIAQRGLAR